MTPTPGETTTDSDGRDLDTRQHKTQPPFFYWEGDHTALVHVLWHAKHRGMSLDDADEIASMVMRSRWLAANRAEGAMAELTATAAAVMEEGVRRRPSAMWDWISARKDRLRAKGQTR